MKYYRHTRSTYDLFANAKPVCSWRCVFLLIRARSEYEVRAEKVLINDYRTVDDPTWYRTHKRAPVPTPVDRRTKETVEITKAEATSIMLRAEVW